MLSFVLILLASSVSALLIEPGAIIMPVDGVEDQPVLLPCDTTPDKPGDMQMIVFVFKDNATTPICSLDSRPHSRSSSSSIRCSDPSLEIRAQFWNIPHTSVDGTKPRLGSQARPFWESPEGVPTTSGLVLQPTKASDAGTYLCRVDFQTSPTQKTYLKLRVVASIHSLTVRGFVPHTRPIHSSSGSLLSLGASRVTKGPSIQVSRTVPSSAPLGDFYPSGASEVFSEWSSSMSGRKVSIAQVRQLGPYATGEELILQCEAIGGSPRPSLVWVEGGLTLTPSSKTGGQHRSSTTLRISPLGVQDIDRTLSCVGENSPRTPLRVDTVRLEVSVPPSTLQLFLNSHAKNLSVERPFSSDPRTMGAAAGSSRLLSSFTPVMKGGFLELREGQTSELICYISGTRPSASILWTTDEVPVPDHLIQTTSSPDPDIPKLFNTQSTLKLLGSPRLHKSVVQCRASVSTLPQHSATAKVTLRVMATPEVVLTGPVPQEGVRENSTLPLNCHVTAYPTVTGSIYFYKEDQLLSSVPVSGEYQLNVSTEVRVSGPQSAGQYSCAAENSLGKTVSAALLVKVNYAPRCQSTSPTVFSTRGDEFLSIDCLVQAQPSPSAFWWYSVSPDNSTRTLLPTSSGEGPGSTLTFKVPETAPFPTLLCYANNTVGSSVHPCQFHINPAVEPGPVESCVVHDAVTQPHGSVTISCLPGSDGGLNQSFTLGVLPVSSNPKALPPRAAYILPYPTFKVTGLTPNEEYTMTITATNARGQSAPVTISYTVPSLEASPLSTIVLSEEVAPLLLSILGALTFVIICSVTAIVVRCLLVKKSGKSKPADKSVGGSHVLSSAEYTRLRRCSNHNHHRSGIQGSGAPDALLQMCGVQCTMGRGCVGGASLVRGCVTGAPSESGTSSSYYCGDSLSRTSTCRSTTETLLWSHGSSDTEYHQTFRNSGCYHIDNLTPPDCIYTSRSPCSTIDSSDRRSLEGSNPELQLINSQTSPTRLSPDQSIQQRTKRGKPDKSNPNSGLAKIHANQIQRQKESFSPTRVLDASGDSSRSRCRDCEKHGPYNQDVISSSSTASSSGSRPSSSMSTITVAPNPNYRPPPPPSSKDGEDVAESYLPLVSPEAYGHVKLKSPVK